MNIKINHDDLVIFEQDDIGTYCENCPIEGSNCPLHYWECLMDPQPEDKPTHGDCIIALQELAQKQEDTIKYYKSFQPRRLSSFRSGEESPRKFIVIAPDGSTVLVELDPEGNMDIPQEYIEIYKNYSNHDIQIVPLKW